MWYICLLGWVKFWDFMMRLYVGCWWIYFMFFEEVWDDIMLGKIVNYFKWVFVDWCEIIGFFVYVVCVLI